MRRASTALLAEKGRRQAAFFSYLTQKKKTLFGAFQKRVYLLSETVRRSHSYFISFLTETGR